MEEVREATLGAARGFPTVFGVILGTGVGGGIVIDGKVLTGANAIAGAIERQVRRLRERTKAAQQKTNAYQDFPGQSRMQYSLL